LNQGQKFRRWDWISYEYTRSKGDLRAESQKVLPESLIVGGKVKEGERARFLNPLVRDGFKEADDRGESLTLLRPQAIELSWTEKSDSEIASERQKHQALAGQLSMFDDTARPLEPCPVQFYARWRDNENKLHNHECDDWETSTAFNRFEKDYGRKRAIEIIKEKFEVEYLSAGLVLAFSTHSRRNVTFGQKNQWLLVGLLRLDSETQGDLLLQ